MAHHKSEYENYILVSRTHKNTCSGTYQRFLKTKEFDVNIKFNESKTINTYTYNGELYVSKLTSSEISKIQSELIMELTIVQ